MFKTYLMFTNLIALLTKEMDSDEFLAMNLFIEFMTKEIVAGRIRDEADIQTASLGFVDYILDLDC